MSKYNALEKAAPNLGNAMQPSISAARAATTRCSPPTYPQLRGMFSALAAQNGSTLNQAP
jgi:hypothetical protein